MTLLPTSHQDHAAAVTSMDAFATTSKLKLAKTLLGAASLCLLLSVSRGSSGQPTTSSVLTRHADYLHTSTRTRPLTC